MQRYLDIAYPHICTCTEDSEAIQSMIGIDEDDYETQNKMAALNGCSEKAEAAASKKKYRNKMSKEVAKNNTDWTKVAKNVFKEGDKDYDKKISTDEFADSIFYQYDIEAEEEDKQWIKDNIDGYCGKYKETTSQQFNQTGLKQCITENGKGIWEGAKEWEDEQKEQKKNPEQKEKEYEEQYDKILNDTQTNTD